MSRSERKAKGRAEARKYQARQSAVEHAFRAQLGWSWSKVERELRNRGLKFFDSDPAKSIDRMIKELGVSIP